MRKAENLIERAFNLVGYIKAEWEGRTSQQYHESDEMSAILKTGKRYYKNPATAYEEHIWTYAAVWAIANAAAMLPFKAFQLDKKGKKEEIENHWLLDLLKFPNKKYTGYDLMEGTFSFLELMGDSYWEITRNKNSRQPTGFYLMRSDRVEVIGSEKELVKAYAYTPNTTTFMMDPESVIHFKNFSPKSEINGQGSIRAATSALEADFLGSEYFKDFFRRGAQPSFVLQVPHRMSEPSYERLRGALKKGQQGVGKQRGVLIVEEGGQYVETSKTPAESGESEAAGRAQKSIAAGVGVPPIKLQSLEGASYANARFQDISFWRSTMEPRMRKFFAKITLDCLKNAGSDVWIAPDLAKVLMNIDEFKNEVDSYCNLVDKGILSRNDVRRKLDEGDVEGGDILTVDPNLVPLSDLLSEKDIEERAKMEDEEEG